MGTEERVSQSGPLGELLTRVDQAVLSPVDMSLIDLSSNSSANVEVIRRNSLSLNATALLALTGDEITVLSKKIRLLFTKIGSRSNLKIDRMNLEQFKEGNENSLVHELDHLRKTRDLRPEVIKYPRLIFCLCYMRENFK